MTEYADTPFDTGPLSWVMGEIRDALGRSRDALREAADKPAEAQGTPLQHARSHLHQAHGALQIVDLDGVSVLTEGAEQALDRFKNGALACGPAQVQVVAEAYQAVVEYLEELLAGSRPQPVRLFPYHRALQELLGNSRAHPAELLTLDLAARPVLPPHTPAASDYPGCRARFERALLPYLKSTDPAAQREQARALHEAVAQVAAAQDEPAARVFWTALECFAELVANGQLEGGVFVKQLFGQINLQLRRLAQGQGEQPPAMLRDALFFVAAAPEPTAQARLLRQAYALEGAVPPDYETRRYGRIDPAALAQAKAALTQAQEAWNRLAAEIDPALEERFEQALATLEGAGAALGAPGLTQLLAELRRVARDSVRSGRGEQFSLEVASAMLFLEHSLEQIRQLPPDFEAQADAVGARLLALAAGETPPPAPAWQGELARRIQEAQTVQVLAGEMRAGLRQVEKVLDDFYADPGKRAALADVDPALHQMQGALALLDQEAAMRAAEHVKEAVRALAAGTGPSDVAALENIAQNVGALGFFIDTLAHSTEAARERFEFDAAHALFQSVPFGRRRDEAAPVVEAPPLAAPPELASSAPASAPAETAAETAEEAVEAELLEIFIGEAQEVLELVRTTLPQAQSEPSNQQTLTVLRRAFHTLKGSGRMVGLNQFADGAHAVEKVMNQWLAEARSATADLFALLERAEREMSAWVAELAAAGRSGRSSAALVAAAGRVQEGGAFEMEETAAAEVIPLPVPDAAPEAVAPAEAPPDNVIEFPAAAPADANVRRIGHLEIALPLYSIYMGETEQLMRVLREDFDQWRAEPARPVAPAALKAAHTLAGTSATVGFEALRDVAYALETTLQELAPPAPQLNDAQRELLDTTLSVAGDMLERFSAGELPPPQPELIERLQNLRAHLPREAPASPYAEAAPELRDRLDTLFAETYSDLISNPPPESSMPGLGEVPRVPEAVVQEMDQLFDAAFDDAFDAPVLTQVAPEPLAASPALPVPDAVLTDAPLEHEDAENFTGSSVPAPEDEEHAQTFALGASPADDAEGLLEPSPETSAVPEPVADIDELLLTAESVTAAPAPADEQEAEAGATPAADAEPLLEPLPELTLEPEPAGDELLLPVESLDAVPAPADDAEAEAFALGAAPVADAEALLEPVPEPALEPEPVPEASLPATGPARDELLLPADSVSAAAAPADEQEAEAFALGASPLADAEALLEPAAQAVAEMPSSMGISATPDETAPLAAALADDLDPDLLPVFIEEATDLLPQIGAALRSWQQKPADTAPAHAMQRMLHTVKGSARMAGAMRLGQHTHDIETQVENMVHAGTSTPAAFDELMANFDQAMLMFERLQAGEAAAAPLPAAQPAAPHTSAAPQAPTEEQQAVQARTPLVRVRADILDRLVNQAGEVSIARSKLETQIGTVKASLDDFADNLTRLRAQLREIEIQAETQIASRLSIAGEREFDPLEFDRFTRLQELTRMMAESVSDVASFHDGLVRAIDGASGDLAVQSRLTRDLQQDLMRVRMVPFASLSERLFRVARQAAKELDKRVNLDIRGGNVEIDRSVLEQMAAPFEHLLRNAIVHGIEPRARRAAAGKPETGELLVQVSQQGNEVVLAFSDDGGGLDLERIRAKAEERGLLEQGQVVSDAACADLIFEPGFSTADALTELAGRGVGMDVVRSEAESLGGRVAIDSTRGAGTRFTIHLPLTLAVTQVVLTRSAGTVYALPAILVEQVLQVKEAAMQMALTAGRIEHQGAVLPLHYLPTLLGDREARPLVQRSSPVLVLRNGADRIALLVDLVEGNREVVVKNIGPQLARMAGIAGATVLGSGDIVLILNPVTLAHHLELHPELRAQGGAAGAGAAPVLFERRGVIMVVDDSLTVRKVTQRLLEREGYQVVLAKDGVDALEQVQETRPDLMLVDIEMPRMDGFDLTRNIRGNDSTRDIPIIMITSRTADKHRNYAFDLGVNGYFGKPYQDAVLLEAIAGLLKQPA